MQFAELATPDQVPLIVVEVLVVGAKDWGPQVIKLAFEISIPLPLAETKMLAPIFAGLGVAVTAVQVTAGATTTLAAGQVT